MINTPSSDSLSGVVTYFYAFDIAYEMRRGVVPRLLGQPVEGFTAEQDRRRPRKDFSQPPQTQMVRLPTIVRNGSLGRMDIIGTVTFLPVGGVSVALQVPFAGISLEDLVSFYDLRFTDGSLSEHARALVVQVGVELRELLVRPHPVIGDAEAYTVFCVHPAEDGDGVESRLATDRRGVAALLTGERDAAVLSQQQVDDSTAMALSYYRSDVVVVGWEAALVVDKPASLAETLRILELANLQLAELKAYDAIIDTATENTYREVARRFPRNRRKTIAGLRELRLDLMRLSEELSNTTKYFGDWHLARVYHLGADRFHLDDWRSSISEKLKVLDDLYQLLQSDKNSRYMMILEVVVVSLFTLDVAILVIQAV